MSTCKALLSKITNKNAFYEQEDVTQNIFAFRVVGICILFYSFVMILNCLHIFIVDQAIFTRGYVAACVLTLIYGLLLVKMGLEHPFTKYLSVTAIGLIVMVASASLTYHMIIIMMIPIISKRQIMRQSLNSTPPVMGGAASGIRPEDYLTMA